MIILPMQPSPPGCRVNPGAQMHMYVPIRFLQVMPLLAQSSIPSSHSFWSGKQTAYTQSKRMKKYEEIDVYACMCSSDVTQTLQSLM